MATGLTADRASIGDGFPWPASILLAQEAYVAASRNDTTATAKSRAKHTVEVTFWIANPPAVSFYTFHFFKSPSISDADTDSDEFDSDAEDSEEADKLEVQPRVVGSEGRFVLIRTFFACGDNDYEYFIYKGDPKSPSLESVPLPDDDRLHGVCEFGIVPHGGDGDHYLLIALCDAVARKDYLLHIYSSEDRTWRTKELLNPCPRGSTVAPYKVMLLRDGVLVWVDLMRGMLVCDVLQEHLRPRYIPLPDPLPGNREDICNQSVPEASVRRYRDVTCVNGLIKFVEMERRVIVTVMVGAPPERPSDPRNKDALYDSDLIMRIKRRNVDNKPKTLRSANGWSAMTWTREFGSDCWLKGSIVDVDDILVDDSVLSALLSGQRNESTGSLTFKKMYSACPILSTDGNDILYLKSSRKFRDPYGWVIAVDLAQKTLKVEPPRAHPFGIYSPSQQTFLPCALVNHLKMSPGIKVSAIQIAQTGSSANDSNNSVVCVREPDSYESENKRPRLLAEKVNHEQDVAQSTVQNVFGSHAHPDQNNMPPQLCFNRWEDPGYGGYSSCAPQNNPPLPQCFNKPTGHCNPVYAPYAPAPDIHTYGNQSLWQQPLLMEQQPAPSRAFGPHVNVPLQPLPQYFSKSTGPCNPVHAPSAPAPNIPSYGNYQSMWQQPLLPEQMAPIRAFGPHVALQPYYNNWWGARHHVKHPAGNSYAQGAHSGSGNQGFGYQPIYHDYRC